MKLKLYEVIVETSVFVVAESEREAEIIGTDHVKEELDNSSAIANIVEDLKYVPHEWRSVLPYGDHSDTTVEEWVNENKF